MRRIDIETKLNESRTRLLKHFSELTEEEMHRPLTPSEHDPSQLWHALDHLGHLALVEENFVAMIRRHLEGVANPVGLLKDDTGVTRSREHIMARVHAMTDTYQREHHDDSFSKVVALTGGARAASLQLLAELSDVQLEETLVGAPWADGTIGGVIGANADHARMHWKWATEAGLLSGDLPSLE